MSPVRSDAIAVSLNSLRGHRFGSCSDTNCENCIDQPVALIGEERGTGATGAVQGW